MLLTVGDASSDERRRALRTDQVFLAILTSSRLLIATIVHASEIRILALEAHVVRAFEHSEGLQIVIEPVIRIIQASFCVEAFKFRPFNRLGFDDYFDLPDSL